MTWTLAKHLTNVIHSTPSVSSSVVLPQGAGQSSDSLLKSVGCLWFQIRLQTQSHNTGFLAPQKHSAIQRTQQSQQPKTFNSDSDTYIRPTLVMFSNWNTAQDRNTAQHVNIFRNTSQTVHSERSEGSK